MVTTCSRLLWGSQVPYRQQGLYLWMGSTLYVVQNREKGTIRQGRVPYILTILTSWSIWGYLWYYAPTNKCSASFPTLFTKFAEVWNKQLNWLNFGVLILLNSDNEAVLENLPLNSKLWLFTTLAWSIPFMTPQLCDRLYSVKTSPFAFRLLSQRVKWLLSTK